MMRCIALRLLLTACVCCLGHSESLDQILSRTVETAIEKIEALSQRLEEMQSGLELMQGSQNDLHRKVEDIMTKLETSEELDLQREILNNSCSKDQIAVLHESLSTEIERVELAVNGCSSSEQISSLQVLLLADECAEGSHECSPNAECEDAFVKYECKCLQGYSGDGFTCEDVNECITIENLCHKDAHCTNTGGSYTCSCLSGYSGDGFSCEDVDECRTGKTRCHKYAQCINSVGSYSCECSPGFSGDGFQCEVGPCEFPSNTVSDLGCVTPVMVMMSAEEARENCLKQGGRLLEGITSQNQLNELKEKFSDYIFEGYVWIGIQEWKWAESRDPIETSLWGSDQPDRRSETCGYIRLTSYATPYLGDYPCDTAEFSLCQKSLNKN